ncbi:MAG: 2-oxoacid:ferredoxin oxidoreductase subunit gamma [Nitrospinae bacterium RIFCSPLOWO2_12_FULL_45_22]|nr:MAG: 2-oxoacid:ferredoxin oxidoreductase subunit gamma [Nitrospinae bacterium RIFCSPLOWO2_12_FULL_45_22]
MQREVIIAGFGGQGVLLIGQLIAYSGMLEGKAVTWLPSYGPEIRGGTCHVIVIVSDRRIGSPYVTQPAAIIVMNRPSLDKFEDRLNSGGILLINSSLTDRLPERKDIRVIAIPATDLAHKLGNSRVANLVMLGGYLGATEVVGLPTMLQALQEVFPEDKHHLLPLNKKALEVGMSYLTEP